MRITKRQLRRIIREAATASHEEVVRYLTDRAASYHSDPALASMGDAGAIKNLLYDDFMDDLGHFAVVQDYEGLIDDLAHTAPLLKEDDLEEYWTPGIDTSGRVDTSRADKKPTGEEMGCKDRRTGKTVEPYWQQRMAKWVCP
tara:strand:- start:568 stop:996 length:429 start_codon:yes stop_codon:yes gene_type:complete